MANKKILGIGIILMIIILVMPSYVLADVPIIKSFAVSQGTGNIITIDKPVNLEKDDLLIVIIGTRDGGILQSSIDFELIRHEVFNNGNDRPITSSWYKIAGTNEPTQYNFFRVTGNDREWKAISIAIENYNEFNPIGKTSGATSGDNSVESFTLPMFTTSIDNSIVFYSITGHDVSDTPILNPMNILHLSPTPRPTKSTFFEEYPVITTIGNKTFTWSKNNRVSTISFEILPFLEPLNIDLVLQRKVLRQEQNNFLAWQLEGEVSHDYFEINVFYPNNTLLYTNNVDVDGASHLTNLTELGIYNIEAFVNDTYGNEYFAFESFEVIEGEPQPLSPETMQGIITTIFMTLIIFVLIYFGIKIRSKNVLIMGLIVSMFYGVIMLASGWFWVIGIIFIIVPLILFFEF